MEIILLGLITALNLIFVKIKFERNRWEDAIFDLFSLVGLTIVFGGSYEGLVVATVTSLIISVYLFFSPPKFTVKIRKFFSSF